MILVVDEHGKPMYDEKGKAVLVPTYSILQDEFFEHMQTAGFTDFARGARGSTAADRRTLYPRKGGKEPCIGKYAEDHVVCADL